MRRITVDVDLAAPGRPARLPLPQVSGPRPLLGERVVIADELGHTSLGYIGWDPVRGWVACPSDAAPTTPEDMARDGLADAG
ncbi:MAG TPA: hypothetical protein VF763_10710 [Candidatus Limnocylindrales bacterium]